ncbi:MAG: glycosyltransferase family 4 protein [Arthrobacter sp.]|uniref:glycosyltransferase family 4 protein n=1 Tax=Arthrobacter sp. TaxID=1667 RepID=UPI003494FD33
MPQSDARRTGYVLKVYPRFSETFIVTEILAREAAGETLEIFALRPSTDARFHPELARVQAPVSFVPKPLKLADGWEAVADATRVVPGFARRYADLLPELAGYEATEVHQAIALAAAATRSGLTHLHAHFGSLAGRTAELAAELAGLTFSVTTHAKDLFHESVDAERLGRTLRRAAHTVAISRFNLEHLAAAYPDLADRTHLLYNGLELGRFPFREPPAPGSRLRIAAVGRLVEKKGFAHLLDAVAALGARGVAADLRIAGDGELLDELSARAARLGLRDGAPPAGNTAVLLGPQTQEEIRALLGWADVFAAPCVVGADGNADGLPTVLLEAMAVGVPCVATNVTGIPEAVRPPGSAAPATGILIEPGDHGALVDALRGVAEPGFPRAEVARAARTLVEDRFDSARQARALAALEDRAGAVAGAEAGIPTGAASGAVVGAGAGSPAGAAVAAGSGSLAGLRVAYACVDPGIPFFGTKGASVHVQEIVRALRARGAEVRLYCTRAGDRVPADLADLPVTELPIPPGPAAGREDAQVEASRAMARRIAVDGADLVYERYSLFSTVLASLAQEHAVPGILEVNAPLIDEQRTHRELHREEEARGALRDQARAAARTVCVSEPVADWVRGQVGPAAGSRVVVVANGVNTDRIRPRSVAGTGGPPEGPPAVVFVGTLKPWHGVEVLVDAVARSRGRWRLRIVGDGPLAGRLRDRAASHGPRVGDRIEFAGAVDPERVGALLGEASIAVAPYPAASAADAYFSPLKIYEYLAAGLPVVASRVGQVPGIVRDGRTGVLVEPSDAAELAAALDALAEDPARRARLGAAARAEALAEHGWDRVLGRVLAGLDETLPPAVVAPGAAPGRGPHAEPHRGPHAEARHAEHAGPPVETAGATAGARS